MLQPGERVERYVVEQPLGEGGMAHVFLVRHAELGTRHALKVLRVRSPDLDRRFLQEARLQASLRHPHIVSVTDIFRLNQGPALVMDWVRGPTLHSAQVQGGEIDDALALFRALLRGVGFAHGQDTIHRDLKPDNILLELTEEGLRPRITDFGLARVIREGDGGPRQTRTGITMGTPTYMAPEQMTDASRCDTRSDLYALGAILYEQLSGHVPYPGTDMVTVAMAQRTQRHRPLFTLRPAIPQRISELVDHLLALDPDDRPESCVEVLAELDLQPSSAIQLQKAAPPVTGPMRARALARYRAPGPPPDPATPPIGQTLTPANPPPSVVEPLPPVEPKPRHPEPAPPTPPDPPAAEPPPDSGSGPAPQPSPIRSSRAPHHLIELAILTVLSLLFSATLWWCLAPIPTPQAPPEPAALLVPAPDPAPSPEPIPAEAPPPPPEPIPAPSPKAAPAPQAAPSPAPEPSLEPSPQAAPLTSPEPEPEPEPEIFTIGPGHFQVLGDAEEVWLSRDGRRYGPTDPLTPGTYEILARFGGGPLQVAGKASVVAADRPIIRCAAALQLCTRLP